MLWHNLILPFLICWGISTSTLILLCITDTCDAESMFKRERNK